MTFTVKKFLSSLSLASGLTIALNHGAGQCQLADPFVEMQTTKGTMVIRVFKSLVPNTGSNFLDLVSRGFYDGKTFHRVETWCIQGGDPNGNGTGNFVDPSTGKVRYIKLETNPHLRHSKAGIVAMARSQNPNSASCQFYILKQPVPQLDNQYAVFGGVVKGLNTIYAITPGDQIIHAEILEGEPGAANSSGSTGQNSTTQTGTGPSGF